FFSSGIILRAVFGASWCSVSSVSEPKESKAGFGNVESGSLAGKVSARVLSSIVRHRSQCSLCGTSISFESVGRETFSIFNQRAKKSEYLFSGVTGSSQRAATRQCRLLPQAFWPLHLPQPPLARTVSWQVREAECATFVIAV